MRQLLEHRRTLLLQGPMGPFFARLACWLEQCGQQTIKVDFNGGDRWFSRSAPNRLSFRGRESQWLPWLAELVRRERIDAIVLFGQMRPLHMLAMQLAREQGWQVYVFEEGYFRPDYVTLEHGGVNAYSVLPLDAGFYRRQPEPVAFKPRPAGQRFRKTALQAAQYSLAMALARPWFPHHAYHRQLQPLREGLHWLRGGLRKLRYKWQQRHAMELLCAPGRERRWFLLPLQVEGDSQIVHHSHFEDIASVIRHVVASFARHAEAGDWLVIKHHPMDRAYADYSDLIARLTREHGLDGRLLYVHDLHMPTLLKHCRGVVTVNSTTGLQALHHGVPVCALGECFYAVPGMVHCGPLARFWQEPGAVDHDLFHRFAHYAITRTQLNVSFYADTPALE
ncbi:MAG: capsular biosynthesis protein [Desulfovibrionaceae bacterium]|jgi:capsular polysaccharide export protein|nr:capsular biosynthesis protein [Desulfovibrionaceae bacterium]